MNILIVDDEASALRDLSREMRKVVPEDDEIFTARDSKTALAVCKEQNIDVVFLDIQMPDMDGLTLAAKMKEISPLINIIMVTAYPNYALDALKLYVSDYILKPANPVDIQNALLHLRHPVRKTQTGLFVQCFGSFEVFYDGKPVRFSRSKVKELFAYLIDRKGASVSNAQLRAVLWLDTKEDEKKPRKYLAQLVHELQSWLDANELSDIFLHTRDSYAIVPEKIPCDYYRALQQDARALSMYKGEYMCQYDWTADRILVKEKELSQKT
jgi:two-component SAPR family response regulator